MATIKELSESIGISKVGITKWIEKNGYKDRLEKVGNRYEVPADVEDAVRSYFDRREPKPTESINPIPNSENSVTVEILALLREQLESKDREIERLHKQVDDLQAINADMVKAVRELNTIQAMQLTDGTPSELRQSESEVREPAESEQREIQERTTDEQQKKSFWDRIKKHFW